MGLTGPILNVYKESSRVFVPPRGGGIESNMKNDNNKKRSVAVLYLLAAAVALGYAVICENYFVMCFGAMWLCLGALYIWKK